MNWQALDIQSSIVVKQQGICPYKSVDVILKDFALFLQAFVFSFTSPGF